MINKTILCIDDMPTRYDKLQTLAFHSNTQVIVCCRLEEVLWYLQRRVSYNIIACCLDHDLGIGCPNGLYYAQHVLCDHPDLPVAIVSLNVYGASNIAVVLHSQTTDCILLPASIEPSWAPSLLRWFERLTAKAILP